MADQASGVLSPFLRTQRFRASAPFLRGRVLDFGCGVGELSTLVAGSTYVGVDRDPESLRLARVAHPGRRFLLPDELPHGERFDTIVCLAVIEHVPNAADFLRDFLRHLDSGGRIVLTTPHPAFEAAHRLGASLGIFAHEAAEEHEALIDRRQLERAAENVGLEVSLYRRFLFGANQLVVMQRHVSQIA